MMATNRKMKMKTKQNIYKHISNNIYVLTMGMKHQHMVQNKE